MNSTKPNGQLPLLAGCSGDTESANQCCDFLVNKPLKLRNAVDHRLLELRSSSAPLMVPTRVVKEDKLTTPIFTLKCVGENTVKHVIRHLNNTGAQGVDKIPVMFWKKTSESLAGPISRLINASMLQGKYPQCFQTSIIKPIHKGKGKPKDDPASYRPVAMLCALSKIFEAVIANQLTEHLEDNGLLPESQHGFRKGRSTVTALAMAMHEWQVMKKKGEEIHIAAFDYSSAFDTIDKTKLLEKLAILGADKTALDWFSSYMDGSRSIVDWNGKMSKPADVTIGVKQGSLLGPILYIIVSMDIPASLIDVAAYADDNTAWTHSKETLESRTEDLVLESLQTGLSLNPEKSQYLIVRNASGPRESTPLLVDGKNIPPLDTLDILGWKLDSKLSARPYIEELHTSLRKTLGVIRRLSAKVSPDVLDTVARGLFLGKLATYCGLSFRARLHPEDPATTGAQAIQVVINDVARVLTKKRRTDHIRTRDLLDRAKLPSLNEMVIRSSGILAWAMASPKHPLHRVFINLAADPRTRTATAGLLRIPEGGNTPMYNVCKIWNACPELRAAGTKHAAKNTINKFARAVNIF